jgi:hypothetical protein
MNTRRLILVVLLLLLAAVVWLKWPSSTPLPSAPVPKSTAQVQQKAGTSTAPAKDAQGRLLPVAPNAVPDAAQRQKDEAAEIEVYRKAFSAPIVFYGKVVDEKGNPVEGAAAELDAADKPWGNSSRYQRVTDAEGLFSIVGIQGARLAVFVSKPGYYPTTESRRGFAYGGVKSDDDGAVPTRGAPAIFVLRKMGESVPLVHLESKGVRIVGDGTPVEVDLATGTQNHGGSAAIRVEIWSDNPTYGAQGPYGWKARVSVPGGGLIERTGEFDFEAPADGYMPTFETSMAQNAEHWRNGFERQFFAQLPDGRFARFIINLKTGGLFFTLESFLNPTPGNRNLEFDPQKAVASPKR